MRFRRWRRPAGFEDTSRKRLAFARKQRLERESLPHFTDQIAEEQHGADGEMARRALSWECAERESRVWRAARWREGRARLFSLPDALRQKVRTVWAGCPHPADPSYFADFLRCIELGKLDPDCRAPERSPGERSLVNRRTNLLRQPWIGHLVFECSDDLSGIGRSSNMGHRHRSLRRMQGRRTGSDRAVIAIQCRGGQGER